MRKRQEGLGYVRHKRKKRTVLAYGSVGLEGTSYLLGSIGGLLGQGFLFGEVSGGSGECAAGGY